MYVSADCCVDYHVHGYFILWLPPFTRQFTVSWCAAQEAYRWHRSSDGRKVRGAEDVLGEPFLAQVRFFAY